VRNRIDKVGRRRGRGGRLGVNSTREAGRKVVIFQIKYTITAVRRRQGEDLARETTMEVRARLLCRFGG